MSFFGKIGSLLKKAAGPVLNTVVGLVPGGKQIVEGGKFALRAIQAAKSFGKKPTPIPKIEPVAVRANISKFVPTVQTGTDILPVAKMRKKLSQATRVKRIRRHAQLAIPPEDIPVPPKAGKKRKEKKSKGGGGRKAPPGGLDLKKIAAMWRAEGKPPTWQAYIKAHSDIRKAS